MRNITRLKLNLSEESQVEECICRIERRGIAGPDGDRRFWLVSMKANKFVTDLPPAEYLIIGPGGKGVRLEVMEEEEMMRSVMIQAMIDLRGVAPDIDSFDWASVRHFANGVATRLDD